MAGKTKGGLFTRKAAEETSTQEPTPTPEPTPEAAPETTPEAAPIPDPEPAPMPTPVQPEQAAVTPEQAPAQEVSDVPEQRNESEKPTRTRSKNYTASAVGVIGTFDTAEDDWEDVARTSGAGRTREYNPFDDAVKQSYETGKPMRAIVQNDEAAAAMLRNAAQYHGYGIDIKWPKDQPDDGTYVVMFKAREKRKVNRRKNQAQDSTEGNATSSDQPSGAEDSAANSNQPSYA